MRGVVLPGLDGSAELRTDFVAAMAPEIEASVIAFPTDSARGYDEFVSFVQPQLPRDRPFVLIGESFSGPVAIKLAAKQPEGLMGLVLCATFARTPVPAPALMRRLAAMLPLRAMPMRLVMHAMMGRWSTPVWSRRLGAVLQGLDDKAFRRRIAEVLSVDVTEDLLKTTCPLLCISAGSDRLLWFDNWKAIAKARPDAISIEVDGPHMLLQANPQGCAAAIKRWARYTGAG